MEAFLIYSCKLAVFLVVLYICLRAFLSRETFHSFNRWALLGGVVLCLLLPLVRVTVSDSLAEYIPAVLLENFFANEAPEEVVVSDELSYSYAENIGTIEVAESNVVAEESSANISLSLVQILVIIYLVGLLVNLIVLARSAYQMMKLIRSNPWQDYKGYKLVVTSGDVVPFSWRSYIVISKADYRDNPDEILTHEIAHIKHHHSLDIIFIECVLLLQWFNPAAWLLKRELKDIHEFQADMSVLESGIDTTQYQLLLVKKAVGASSYTLANSFNHSKIKKRITMMLKQKSSKWARLKLLLLLPLGTLTVLAFARPEVNEPASPPLGNEGTINLQNPKKINKNGEIIFWVDDKKLSFEEYQEILNNSIPLFVPDYIPFAKGKIVTIFKTNETGQRLPYDEIREMFVDGKAPDRSHVNFIVEGKVYSFEQGYKESGGWFFANLEEAKKHDSSPKACELKSKDGSRSSGIFYAVPLGELKLSVASAAIVSDDGSKTPVEVIVKPRKKSEKSQTASDSENEYKAEENNKPKSEVKFTPPVIKKDNPRKQIVRYARMGDKGEVLYAYPTAYDEAKEGERPILDQFVKYVVGSKEYTRKEFEKLINGKVFVENKEDLKSGETDAMEFYSTTQKGLKTPTWYMVKVKEGTTWKDLENEYKSEENNKPKSEVKFTPPVIKKDTDNK